MYIFCILLLSLLTTAVNYRPKHGIKPRLIFYLFHIVLCMFILLTCDAVLLMLLGYEDLSVLPYGLSFSFACIEDIFITSLRLLCLMAVTALMRLASMIGSDVNRRIFRNSSTGDIVESDGICKDENLSNSADISKTSKTSDISVIPNISKELNVPDLSDISYIQGISGISGESVPSVRSDLYASRDNRFLSGLSAVIPVMFTLAVIFTAVSYTAMNTAESGLMINEVCSSNVSVIHDENWDFGDYVELYNPSLFPVSLSGISLTDDLDKDAHPVAGYTVFSTIDTRSGSLEGLNESWDGSTDIIPARGYALIWTQGAENGFGISSDGGETVYLLKSDGSVVDEVTVPALPANASYVRTDTSSVSTAIEESDAAEPSAWMISFATPLSENTTLIWHEVEAPLFLLEDGSEAVSGFYDEDFLLGLSLPAGYENCDIYYTLDGSIPDENSILYTSEIEVTNVCDNPNVYRTVRNVVKDWEESYPGQDNVDKAFIIRAVAVDEDGVCSEVATRTYFVDMDQYRGGYILSLVSDPDGLFGEDGIYVTGTDYDEWYTNGQNGPEPVSNFDLHGREAEVEVSVELFCDELLMSQNAGMRIQGLSHRHIALKRFMLYSRNCYSGSYYFDCDLFEKDTHSFLLRDDFADLFLQSLVPDRDLGCMDAVQVTVFLDGEYWYDTYIREKYSEDYLAQEFGLDREQITFVDSMPEEIYEFLDTHDLSQSADYEEFGDLIDIQNYIDYMVCNVYLANVDLNDTKNLLMWRSSGTTGEGYDDGRWRFLLYDMDIIRQAGNEDMYNYEINTFTADTDYVPTILDQTPVFAALKENEDFCRQFTLTFMDFANTYFEKSNVERQLNEWGEDLSWCFSFFDRRSDYIVPDLADEFGLTGTLEEITLEVSATDNGQCPGTVTVNTVTPDLSSGSWSGWYYTDYPVTITAEAADGYVFAAWHHGDEIYTEASVSVQLESGDNVWEAEFIPR